MSKRIISSLLAGAILGALLMLVLIVCLGAASERTIWHESRTGLIRLRCHDCHSWQLIEVRAGMQGFMWREIRRDPKRP